MDSYHLIADVYDTVINKERNYTNVDICIDKSSGLPDDIIIRSRNTTYGDGVSSYYSESRYFDYKFDRDDIDIAAMAIPDGFHPPRQQSALPNEPNVLLALGSVAPGWILYDAAGEQMSLAQLKGKVVLLDFFFIGCGGCMEALKPLNKIHEQYRNQNVAIVSMTFRDDRRSTAAFKKNYHIKYPIYIDAAGVVKSYHVSGFPTFYFIDKEGKVASVIVGYNDNFEKEVSSIMNNLIAK
jgi:peroxiredoxin